MKRKINSLEYRLYQIIGRHDLIEECEPRTLQEEEAEANKWFINQLESFKLKEGKKNENQTNYSNAT